MIRKSFFYKKLFSGFAGECIRAGIQKNYGRYEKWNVKSFLPGWLYPDFSRMRHRSGQCMAFSLYCGKIRWSRLCADLPCFSSGPGTSYCSDGVCRGPGQQKECGLSFDLLEPKGSKWHLTKYIAMAGNYMLMMFYTTVAGWMLLYFF